MISLSSRAAAGKDCLAMNLLQGHEATCPHCWERFRPEETLFLSEHEDLLGDLLLGPEQQQRFPASRFTPEGDAIDARGMRCQRLACPKCHGRLERISRPEGFACGACRLLYAIDDGLPNMLIDDAKRWPVGDAGTT